MVRSQGFTCLQDIKGKMTTIERLPCTLSSTLERTPKRHLIRNTNDGTGVSWCKLIRPLSWFEERDGPLCQQCHVKKWRDDIPGREELDPPPFWTTRPFLVPTEVITLRISTLVMDIIRRRAKDSNMSATIWLVERVIRNEVTRKHRRLEDRKIIEEIILEGR